jgi:hypothetical protein
MNHPQLKPLLATLVAALVCLEAHADTPLSLTISQTMIYDSNIQRDNNQKYRDFVSSTGARLDFEKSYGRQTYTAGGQVALNRYKNTPLADNDSFDIDLGLSSTISSDWLVNLKHSSSRSLQDFGDQGTNRFREEITSNTTSADVQYGLHGRWSFTGSASHRTDRYDNGVLQDKNTDRFRVGLRYSPTDLLYFDAGLSPSKIDPQNPALRATLRYDPIKRMDADVYTSWVVTGYSKFSGRLGWTQEQHEERFAYRDFRGLTGNVVWNFTPAGKVSYRLVLDRDTNNSGGESFGTVQLNRARLNTGLSGSATWSATSKLAVTGKLNVKSIKETTDVVFLTLGGASDSRSSSGTYRSVGLGLSYSPTRMSLFRCDVEAYKRSETEFAIGYDGETVSCSAAITLDP